MVLGGATAQAGTICRWTTAGHSYCVQVGSFGTIASVQRQKRIDTNRYNRLVSDLWGVGRRIFRIFLWREASGENVGPPLYYQMNCHIYFQIPAYSNWQPSHQPLLYFLFLLNLHCKHYTCMHVNILSFAFSWKYCCTDSQSSKHGCRLLVLFLLSNVGLLSCKDSLFFLLVEVKLWCKMMPTIWIELMHVMKLY